MPIDATDDPKVWRINLFGSLQIVAPTGVAVSIPGKKTGELLAYLALNKGRSHTREKLINIIWGGSDVENARTRLRQEIVKLRSILASVDSETSPLQVTRDSCLITEDTVVDVIQFEKSCLQANRETELEMKRLLYLDASRLYTSDLLPGYDAAWIVAERTRLNHSYSRALLDLAESQRRLQDYSGAEETLRTLTSHDPLAEEGYVELMRLYADLGQPTRVQQQFQAMDRALRDGLGMEPTAGTMLLADELREAAGRKASAITANKLPSAPVTASSTASTHALAHNMAPERLEDQVLKKPDDEVRTPNRIRVWRALVFALLAVLLTTGAFKWRDLRHSFRKPHSVPAPISNNLVSWVYRYQSRPGEKPNSEGRAIVTDGTGIYVTGLIQTDKDDTDILTLKLDHYGSLLWVDRYSSPEHDCDRAFSACVDGKGGLYVAGETYVPAHFKDKEGWHLTLLHYDANGHRLWDRRSPDVTRNEGGNVQVASDAQGGCYLGGTALQGDKQLFLVMRYDSSGKLLWSKTVGEGTRNVFSRLAVNLVGDVYLGGTARMSQSLGGLNERWLISRITLSGETKWIHLVDGPGHGVNILGRVETDRAGDAIVAGVLTTNGASPVNPSERRIGLYKFNEGGDIVWKRIVSDSSPNIEVTGLSNNFAGDIVVTGSERHSDGTNNALLACFDTTGYQNHIVKFSAPRGFKNIKLSDAKLYDDNKIRAFGETSQFDADEMERHETSLVYAQFDAKGAMQNTWLYNSAPDTLNVVRDRASDSGGSTCTGQTGPRSTGQRDLLVIHMNADWM